MRRLALHIIRVTVIFSLTVGPVSQARIIYVDDDAIAPGDGTSWTTAHRYLQDALADAESAEGSVEIRVAQGTYKPDQGANQVAGDRDSTFHVTSDISLRGGFAGLGHSDPNARQTRAFETILSADLADDDLPVVRATDMLPDENRFGNSYSVLVVEDPDGTALIKGFTITGGDRAMESYLPSGGAGIWCVGNSSPTISNCTFTANCVSWNFGGAIFGGAPEIVDCTFDRNYGDLGGAVSSSGGSMRNCHFINNAAMFGGALSGYDGFIQDSSFIGNYAAEVGGTLDECTGTIANSIFIGNSAADGGAIFLGREGRLTLANCTVAQNIASTGRTLSCRSYGPEYPVNVDLTNCILWNGRDEIRSLAGSTVEIRYSDIQGGQAGVFDPCETVVWGPGNIEVDPCFVDPGYWDTNGTADDPNDDIFVAGDYHLKSQAERWDPNGGSWVQDEVTSPCIDAGDPNSDFAGEVWPHGGRINMGAYGGTAEASMSAQAVDMFLPRIACIHWYDRKLAESCQSFLQAHGCSVTLMHSELLLQYAFDDYDLIVIATDTANAAVWANEQVVAALVDTGKPVLGLGEGGYAFFGKLGLTIGSPNGARATFDSIRVLDPNDALFTGPYPVAVPEDETLRLSDNSAQHVVIYLWPSPPESVATFAQTVDDPGYYPLVAQQGHLLWGLTDSPDQLTEAGKRLFLNVVILTANGLLEPEAVPTP